MNHTFGFTKKTFSAKFAPQSHIFLHKQQPELSLLKN
jgi:hypothetical protein